MFTHASDAIGRRFHQLFYSTVYVLLDGTVEPDPQPHLVALTDAVATLDRSNWQPGQELPERSEDVLISVLVMTAPRLAALP